MPNYKLTHRLYLPTDPPWRDAPESKTDELKAESPDGLWKIAIKSLTSRLSMDKDVNFFIGLILNLVNPFPLEVRHAIVNGVIAGLGFKVDRDEDNMLVGGYYDIYPPLPAPEPEPVIDTGVPEDMVRTESGLIIPR